MEVYLFGVTLLLVCFNFFFRKIVEDNIDEFDVEVVEIVRKNFYVDDCFKLVVLFVYVVNLVG